MYEKITGGTITFVALTILCCVSGNYTVIHGLLGKQNIDIDILPLIVAFKNI